MVACYQPPESVLMMGVPRATLQEGRVTPTTILEVTRCRWDSVVRGGTDPELVLFCAQIKPLASVLYQESRDSSMLCLSMSHEGIQIKFGAQLSAMKLRKIK